MEGDDGIGPGDSPKQAGLFEARADDGRAASFDHAGACEQVLASKLGIAHARGVPLEVRGFDPNGFGDGGCGSVDAAKKLDQLFDFAAVEFAAVELGHKPQKRNPATSSLLCRAPHPVRPDLKIDTYISDSIDWGV
jgi:hypothetical protein